MFHSDQQIGSYTLIKRIGRGGFGEVWLAEKRAKFVTTKVAVKLPLDEQVDLSAIEKEATLWEQASGHPNVLPLIDADIIDGQVVIVSEYAKDGSLAEKLKKEGKLPINQAVEMTIGILNGLHFLHNKRIIHRDIKPQNILLQNDTPRLADFGISRAMQTTGISSNIVGTDAYMSPESFRGLRTVETDIWSVGVVLYQLLNGRLPFPSENPSERMYSILQDEFAPLSKDIPPELRRILEKALAKSPENRYRSASAMRDELKEYLIPLEPTKKKIDEPVPEPKPFVDPIPDAKPDIPFTEPQPVEVDETEIKTKVASPPSPEKPKINRLYIALPVAFLLASVIGGAIWLFSSETNLIPYRKGDKFGFSNTSKQIIIDPKYDDAYSFDEELAAVKLSDKMGFINKKGEVVIPLRYSNVSSFKDGLAVASFNNKSGIIDKNGKEIVPIKYDSVLPFDEDFAVVSLNNKFGYVNKNGKEITPLKYDNASGFNNGIACVTVKGIKDDFSDSKQGCIDGSGKEIIPVIYDEVNEIKLPDSPQFKGIKLFDTVLFIAKLNDKMGIIDKTAKEIIPLKYDSIKPSLDGLFLAGLNKKYGYLDANGNEIIPIKYDAALGDGKGVLGQMEGGHSNTEKLFNVMQNEKWGFINKEDQAVIPFKYDAADVFNEGLAGVISNKKFGFIDTNGKEIIPPKYDSGFFFKDGLAAVNLKDKWGFINKEGKEVVPIKYEKVGTVFNADNLAAVKLNGKWGFVDKTGNVVIPIKFDADEKGDFGPSFNEEGLAQVKVNGKYGLIDKTGKEVIPIKYDQGIYFAKDGLARVTLNDKPFYIDKNGTEFYERNYLTEPANSVNAFSYNQSSNIAFNNTANVGNAVFFNTNTLSNNIAANAAVNSSANSYTNTAGNKSPYYKTATLRTNMRLRSVPNDIESNYNIVGVHYKGARVRILDSQNFEVDGKIVTWVKVVVFKDGCDAEGKLGCGHEGASEGWLNGKSDYISLDEN